VLNSLSYSTYLVLSRGTLERYDRSRSSRGSSARHAGDGPRAAPQLARVDWGALTTGAWVGFAYALVFGTVLAYGLNNWVLRHNEREPRRVRFVYLQPLVGALAAWWVLAERPRGRRSRRPRSSWRASRSRAARTAARANPSRMMTL